MYKGIDILTEAPTRSGGDFLPPADNVYGLGSVAYSWKELHVETVIYATSVTGNWSPSADDTYYLGTDALGWKGLHMPDTLITDDTGYVLLRNNANDAYVGLKALAATLYGTNGLDIDPATDVDVDLITVGVTGTPKLWWDESEDAFALTHNLIMADTKAINTGLVDGDYYSFGAVDNDTNTITEVARITGAAQPSIDLKLGRFGTAALGADAAHRGMFYFTEGGAGVADLLYCIMKGADNNYSAIQVAVG